MLIDVLHTTQFSYTEPIEESVVEACLEPRSDEDQRRLYFALEVQPRTPLFSYRDGFTNVVHCFSVLPAHHTLTLIARSRVETLHTNPFAPPVRTPPPLDAVDTWPFLQFADPVLRVEGVEALAERFRPAQPEHS